MATKEDKAKMSRLIVDLLGKGNLNIVDELAAPDFIEPSGPPNHRNGVAGAKAMAGAFGPVFLIIVWRLRMQFPKATVSSCV